MGFFVVILILKHGIYPWFEKGSLEKKGRTPHPSRLRRDTFPSRGRHVENSVSS